VSPPTPAELEQRLLGGPRRWRRREASQNAGVSLLSARKLWRALGFASVDDDQVAFTDADTEALAAAVAMVREELLDEETTIAFARALGRTTDRLVSWQIETLTEYVQRTGGSGSTVGSVSTERLATLVEDLERLLVYSWRRKLAAAVSALDVPDTSTSTAGELCVVFADLVSYTQLSHRLSPRDLGTLVQRFEALAADVVTGAGGRVIKTVGDEMLFTAADPVAGAMIGLTLSELMAVDPVVPDVRVGLAHGLVLRSLGDVYGPTVNLASRLTALAEPGTVVTEEATAAKLADDHRLLLVAQRRRNVRGFGSVEPLLITRAG
jgi:adenylate cyclase